MVDGDELQETLQLLTGRRWRPLLHCPDLSGISLKPPLGNYKFKETDLSGVEFTLFQLNKLFILQESLKHQLHSLDVSVMGSGEDQYIIKADKNKMAQHVTEYVINKGLKNSWVLQLVGPKGIILADS